MRATVLGGLAAMALNVGMADDGPFELEWEILAPGVWAGIRPDSQRFPVMGTTTFVIGDVGVVVFDGGGLPVMAEKVIARISAETDLPVTHVVISHWHGDHAFGIHRYSEAFPGVEFVAQEFTHAALNGSPVDYIDRYHDFDKQTLPRLKERVETGKDAQGEPIPEAALHNYRRMLADAAVIGAQFKQARVTSPTLVFSEKLVIYSGLRRIELLHLPGNTEGDIVMWLPGDRIVATGDLVVWPTPYAFNMPPRPWAEALKRLKALDYRVLVPGHGAIQRDTRYVDLLIESAESIADQRDRLLGEGLSSEAVERGLDFSAFESRFTGGDEYTTVYFKSWFEEPFRKAALKAVGDGPMVDIGPRAKSGRP